MSTSTCQQKTVIGVCPPRPASGAGGGIDPTQRAQILSVLHTQCPPQARLQGRTDGEALPNQRAAQGHGTHKLGRRGRE